MARPQVGARVLSVLILELCRPLRGLWLTRGWELRNSDGEGRTWAMEWRQGLARYRCRGSDGMKRWLGFGILADNLINMGRWLAAQPA